MAETERSPGAQERDKMRQDREVVVRVSVSALCETRYSNDILTCALCGSEEEENGGGEPLVRCIFCNRWVCKIICVADSKRARIPAGRKRRLLVCYECEMKYKSPPGDPPGLFRQTSGLSTGEKYRVERDGDILMLVQV